MNDVRLSISSISRYTFDELCDVLANAEGDIVLDVPCSSIGSANSHLDIAADYLDALFVGESIEKFCGWVIATERWKERGFPYMSVQFSLRPRDVSGLVKKLLWLSPAFDEDKYWDDAGFEDVRFAVAEFEDKLVEQVIHFPELADNYLANYIGGAYDRDPRIVEDEYIKHPEWQYHFWRSFASDRVGYDFYVSPRAWIAPQGSNVRDLLSQYGGFDKVPSLQPAECLSTSGLPAIVFNEISIVCYPLPGICTAQECAQKIWPQKPYGYIETTFLSEEADVLVACDAGAQYIFFGDSLERIPQELAEKYLDAVTVTSERLRVLLGIPVEIACPWHELDDEQFEELCYDVICHCGRYDPGTVRKMGKSRSRDGGRDIVVYSHERVGKPPVKFIVQCKLIRDNSSLSGSKIHISDTVVQYCAGGFCVMTSGIIDSTLYDKMDGIANNLGIEIDWWSRLELERFLARHSEIRSRYFSG